MVESRAQPSPMREFHLSAELRRAILYWLVGAILIGLTALCVAAFGGVQQQPNAALSPLQGAILFGGVAVASAIVGTLLGFRYRIRIDSRGISRRRFWQWELWPWQAFQAGQVEPGDTNESYRWLKPGAPPRVLSLGSIDEEPRRLIRAAIRSIWVPPETAVAPTIPLTTRSSCGRVRLCRRGLILRTITRWKKWQWPQVVELHVIRRERDDREPRALEVHVPGRVLRLLKPDRGCSFDQLAQLIERNLKPGRTVHIADRDPPICLRELEIREAAVQSNLREVRGMKLVVLPLTALFLLLVPFGMNIWIAKVYGLMACGFFWLIRSFAERDAESKLAELAAARETIEAGAARDEPQERSEEPGVLVTVG